LQYNVVSRREGSTFISTTLAGFLFCSVSAEMLLQYCEIDHGSLIVDHYLVTIPSV
jgi:hypothetical protein